MYLGRNIDLKSLVIIPNSDGYSAGHESTYVTDGTTLFCRKPVCARGNRTDFIFLQSAEDS